MWTKLRTDGRTGCSFLAGDSLPEGSLTPTPTHPGPFCQSSPHLSLCHGPGKESAGDDSSYLDRSPRKSVPCLGQQSVPRQKTVLRMAEETLF